MEMPYEKIPFMHWGIITRYNFQEDLIPYVPRKRWDPLTSVEIKLYDESSRRFIRTNKRKGHFSYISPFREKRPEGRDAFEKIVRGEDYAIFVSLDRERGDSPFSVRPVMRSVRSYRAVTIINRYPAMVRHLDPEIAEKIRSKIEDPYTKVAFGISLITFPTRYIESLSEASADDIKALLESMVTAIGYCIEEAKRQGINLVPVYPFFNIGPMAGGSQPRLHAQVYVDLNMDGHGAFMESILQAFEEQHRSRYCHLCYSSHGKRLVYENRTWLAWTTASPRRNYHVRMAPKRHVERITELSSSEIAGLAEMLVVVSKALDAVGVDRNRNVLVYSNPYGYESFFHLFVDIMPFERLGGIEILDSCRVIGVSPEEAADRLRRAIGKC